MPVFTDVLPSTCLCIEKKKIQKQFFYRCIHALAEDCIVLFCVVVIVLIFFLAIILMLTFATMLEQRQ